MASLSNLHKQKGRLSEPAFAAYEVREAQYLATIGPPKR
jgi:hypothetical protein